MRQPNAIAAQSDTGDTARAGDVGAQDVDIRSVSTTTSAAAGCRIPWVGRRVRVAQLRAVTAGQTR